MFVGGGWLCLWVLVCSAIEKNEILVYTPPSHMPTPIQDKIFFAQSRLDTFNFGLPPGAIFGWKGAGKKMKNVKVNLFFLF